jgi:transposase InsO family protein
LQQSPPIYQRPRTSDPYPEHRIYPYLLRDLEITRPGHVWCADITYIPMRPGFLYLVAIMDWASRKVVAWRVSNTMDAEFCVAALKEALAGFGRPEIFNTDQGSQFSSNDFTDVLRGAEARISMDGRSRWMDDVFIERLWRSLKYECVYLNAFETGSELRTGSAGGSAITTGTGLTLAFADERRTRSMGRQAQRHIRGMPRMWRSPEWRRNQPGHSLAQPPNCPGRRDHLTEPSRASSADNKGARRRADPHSR